MFRKTAFILAAICIMTSLTACGNKDNNNTTSGEPYQSKRQGSSYNDDSGLKKEMDGVIDGVEDGINGVEEGINDAIDSVTPSSNQNGSNSMR